MGFRKVNAKFLYVGDVADACVFLMESGIATHYSMLVQAKDMTIGELVETVMSVVGFKGEIVFDAGRPDGTPRKLLNVDWMRGLGW